jgi:hypothetical protein
MSHKQNDQFNHWYYENLPAEEQIKHDLKIQAGLTFVGIEKNEDGKWESQWMGDIMGKQWDKYEELLEEFNNNI